MSTGIVMIVAASAYCRRMAVILLLVGTLLATLLAMLLDRQIDRWLVLAEARSALRRRPS